MNTLYYNEERKSTKYKEFRIFFTFFKKRLDFYFFLCYNSQVDVERWLSWSKAHDWKSCER